MRKRSLRRRLAEAVRNERRAVSSARRAAHEVLRLRLALESLPQTVVVWDEDGAVVLRSAPEADPTTAGAGAPLVAAAIEELVKPGEVPEHRTRTLELHGPPPRQLLLSAHPLVQDDEVLGTVAVVDDVSERGRLEAMRRDFVANVSHELRTPVGALALLGEALCGESDPEVVSRLAERITAEADRAARMIEDLLDLSRIEGGGEATLQVVGVASVVSAAVERSHAVAGRRQVQLVVSTADAAAMRVMGDEAQLVSAVANLIDNAVKYSEPGSTVHIAATAAGPEAEIAVADCGVGIPGKDLERIFERFYRVDRARSRGTGGSGLGLSIVRHIATNHGGEVSVDSTEGRGSTFTLRLPAMG